MWGMGAEGLHSRRVQLALVESVVKKYNKLWFGWFIDIIVDFS